MSRQKDMNLRLVWADAARALALIGILLNHFFEEFGTHPWFTNPSNGWPDFQTRIQQVYPRDYDSLIVSFIQFLGWLGDSCPGVFVLLSGFALTWACSTRGATVRPVEFYRHRILRLFPLYVAMHVVILAGAAAIPGSTISMAGTKTLLSLLGLRFDASLFYYINPSWWFIWLILQLYVLFPYLHNLLSRIGVKKFIAVTFLFTFACRLYGIVYSENLYLWMTGIFFGTRLAEFTAGMGLATFLKTSGDRENPIDVKSVLVPSLILYSTGFLCSWFLYGTMVSNLLVSVGMTGLFYCLWKGLIEKVDILARGVIWIGRESYGIFLLHQAPLQWTAFFFQGSWHVWGAIAAIVLSFPAARAINTGVSRLMSWKAVGIGAARLARASALLAALSLVLLLIVEPSLYPSKAHPVFALMMGVVLLFLSFAAFRIGASGGEVLRGGREVAILSIFLSLFVFPAGHGFAAVLIGGVLVTAFRGFRRVLKSAKTSLAAAVLLTGLLVAATEGLLLHLHPVEAGKWGEAAALQVHPTRTFALRPSQETRLRYNNYDYIVRTNSQGLASPEIAVERPTPDTLRVLIAGDAFTMPEGVNYEDSYPAVLGRELSDWLAPRTVQVINAGVTGYGPVQVSQQLKELVPLFKPDIILYEYFINEPEDVQADPANLLKSIGLTRKRFEILHNLMNTQYLEHSRILSLRIAETITGTPSRWRYDKALLKYYRADGQDLYSERNMAAVCEYLREMRDTCRRQGAEMMVYFVPGAVAVMPPAALSYFPWTEDLSDSSRYDLNRPLVALQKIAAELGVSIVDMTPHLKAAPKAAYFSDSWHWTVEGHRVAARVMLDDLKERLSRGKTWRRDAHKTGKGDAGSRE